jgi:hypothetical protein
MNQAELMRELHDLRLRLQDAEAENATLRADKDRLEKLFWEIHDACAVLNMSRKLIK